jgi:hypothetical protein
MSCLLLQNTIINFSSMNHSIMIKYANQQKQSIIANVKKQIKKLNETQFTYEEKLLQNVYQDELYTFSLIDYEIQSQQIIDYHNSYLEKILNSTTEKSHKKYYRIVELNQLKCELNNYYIDENFENDTSVNGQQIKLIFNHFNYE